MLVQIYEIQTPNDAEACIAAGVDHIGTVLLDKAGRRDPVLRDTVRVSAATGAKSSLIPIFRDPDILFSVIDYYRPDYIHFCDNLTDASGKALNPEPFVQVQSRLKETFPETGIIRSIPVPLPGAVPDFPILDIAEAFLKTSDFFLTDTWVPKAPVAGYIGITGQLSDGSLTTALTRWSRIPVILAGGLSPDNVHDALMAVKCAGADSCTRTNRVDGKGTPVRFQKDFQRVADFVGAVRRAEEALQREKAELETRLKGLRSALADREKALPAHSVRPHQMMAIEALEEDIESVEAELSQFRMGSLRN